MNLRQRAGLYSVEFPSVLGIDGSADGDAWRHNNMLSGGGRRDRGFDSDVEEDA